jgi:hypothetical protein
VSLLSLQARYSKARQQTAEDRDTLILRDNPLSNHDDPFYTSPAALMTEQEKTNLFLLTALIGISSAYATQALIESKVR